jgi:hypothetical protein
MRRSRLQNSNVSQLIDLYCFQLINVKAHLVVYQVELTIRLSDNRGLALNWLDIPYKIQYALNLWNVRNSDFVLRDFSGWLSLALRAKLNETALPHFNGINGDPKAKTIIRRTDPMTPRHYSDLLNGKIVS